MAKRIEAGCEERASALWGTTRRDGGTRGSALWGNGGRGGALLLSIVAALTAIPLAAGAVSASGSGGSGGSSSGGGAGPSPKVQIPDALLSSAKANPDETFRVIVQGDTNQPTSAVADEVANASAQADTSLDDAVAKADAALDRARNAYATTLALAKRARAAADRAQADADAKAARAAATGKAHDVAAAHRAAATARILDAVADAAEGVAASAKAALVSAQIASAGAHARLDDRTNGIRNQISDRFPSISGVVAQLTGSQLAALVQGNSGHIEAVTPDVPVVATFGPWTPADVLGKWSSSQTWVQSTGADVDWDRQKDPKAQAAMPAIAVVDSGVEDRSDFDGRLLASVDLTDLPNNSPGDGRGHGTFVAGIAAGAAPGVTGAAPGAKLVSLDVFDDSGMAMTSDVIRACEWILANRSTYNIRVANFSLHSDISAPFYLDPLDRAVEQLWFNGVVVVAAAGNYGTDGSQTGVLYSPADDPFVITVGASDVGSKPSTDDDFMAPWSAWGPTLDGFMKPELSAPGRYLVGPVPQGSTLVSERPGSVVSPGYMQLSGTSFAAPIVSGAAASLLGRHPDFTPDQVKGALMLTAKPMSASAGLAGGVGEVSVDGTTAVGTAPNPNLGLNRFVKLANGGGGFTFDSAAWRNAAQASASWDSASWNSASWNSASWNSASWNSASWNSASWNSASWNSASWNSASWNSGAREDAVDADEPLR